MKIILSWSLSILLVAIGSFKLGQSYAPESLPDSVSAESRVKLDLIELTRKDFSEYQKLKTLEERYQKADEILGKIVVLFLADLGTRLSFKKVPAAALTKPVAPAPTVTPAAVAWNPTPSPNPTASPAVTPSKSDWLQQEKLLVGQKDELAVFEQTRKLAIRDFIGVITKSRRLNGSEVLDIEGRFAGEILFFRRDVHKSDWNIEWDVRLSQAGKSPGGGYILLTNKETGKSVYRTTFNANGPRQFMKPDGSASIIVNVYGGDGYVQLYALTPDGSALGGNFYERKPSGNFEMTGRARLVRMR